MDNVLLVRMVEDVGVVLVGSRLGVLLCCRESVRVHLADGVFFVLLEGVRLGLERDSISLHLSRTL